TPLHSPATGGERWITTAPSTSSAPWRRGRSAPPFTARRLWLVVDWPDHCHRRHFADLFARTDLGTVRKQFLKAVTLSICRKFFLPMNDDGRSIRFFLLVAGLLLLALAGYGGYVLYPRFDLPVVTGAGLLFLAVGAGLASFFSP